MKPVSFLLLLSLAANVAAGYFVLNRSLRAGSARVGATVARGDREVGGGQGVAGADGAGAASDAPTSADGGRVGLLATSILGRLQFSERIAVAKAGEIPAVLAEVQAMAPSATRSELLGAVYKRWGQTNPAEAFEAISRLNPTEKDGRELDILKGWALIDPLAAFEWMDTHPPQITSATTNPANGPRFQALADELLAADRPDLLKAALGRTTNDAERSLLAVRIADYLARYDAPAAVDWLLELPAGAARTSAAAKLTRTIAEESTDLALGLATKLPGNAGRTQAIASVFAQWADTGDPRAAEAWLSSQKPAPAIDTALVAFLPVAATRDEALARRLLEQFSAPASRQRAVDLAANKMALLDPARAIDWTVAQSPESAERVKKLTPFFRTLAKENPDATANRIATMPGLTGEERENLVSVLPPPPPPPKATKK